MKFKLNNKTFVGFIVGLLLALFFCVNILPNLFLMSLPKTLTTDNLQNYSRIESATLDIKGMNVISRSDKIYYDLQGAVPTNKIWSSAVFEGQLDGLYTYPLASNTTGGSLNITIPQKVVYPKLITDQIISEFLSIKGTSDVGSVSVVSYSDLAVKIDFLDKFGNKLFMGTFIQGSPYIFIKPYQNTLNLSSAYYSVGTNGSDWTYSYQGNTLGIFGNGTVTKTGNNLQITYPDPTQGYLTIAATDSTNFAEIKSLAANVIDSIYSSFSVGDNQINVFYKFNFVNQANQDTIFGLLPNQYENGGFDTKNALYKMNTLRGDQYFIKASGATSYTIPRQALTSSFAFENINPDDQAYISSLIEADLKDIVYVRSSAYFGGNDILKLANLLQISDQIKNTDLVGRIKSRLDQEFDDWFNYKSGETGKYFAFDQSWGGVIGYETSGFGGETYNDHHFQYGYFIHAAAILAQYDSDFVKKYGYFIDDLIDDIANINRSNTNFPYLRYFDSYEGHSWATGLGNFSDGNNQESSSEAINAWYAIWLWSTVTKENDLESYAEYLYSSEVNSARTYYLNWYENESIFPDGYSENKASVIWGGKVEYQTFFSTDPQSIEGIQYLPFTPGAIYLYNPSILERDYESFKDNLNAQSVNLDDMNYLYYAMLKGFSVLPKKMIETMTIDQGNSRANMYYWTKFWDNTSSVSVVNVSGTPKYQVTYKDGSQAIM